MKTRLLNDLSQIIRDIKARIQAYADKHNISFEEAEKRAKMRINGKEIRIRERK